jgi:hypothetical protein
MTMFKSLEEIKSAIKLLKEQQGGMDVNNLKNVINARANFLKMGILLNNDLLKKDEKEILKIIGNAIDDKKEQMEDDISEIKNEIENELGNTSNIYNFNLRLKKKTEADQETENNDLKSNNVLKIKKIDEIQADKEIEDNKDILNEENTYDNTNENKQENNEEKSIDNEEQNNVINNEENDEKKK